MEKFTKEQLKGKSQSEIFDLFYSKGEYKEMYTPAGIAGHLHRSVRYMVKFIPDKASKILEVGSGIGHVVKVFFDMGYKNIVGTDVSRVAAKQAIYSELILVCEAKNLPFNDDQFDIAVSVGTYEHIPPKDIDISFMELMRVAKKAILFIDRGGTDPTHYTNEPEEYWVERIEKATGARVRIDKTFLGGSDTHPILINL